MKLSGLAFHVHHNILYEWCWDYDERVSYIKSQKPLSEQSLRLRLFKMIPTERLPPKLQKADAEWEKAYAEWEKAYAEREKAYAEREKAYAEREKAYDKREKAYAEREKAYDEREKAYAENEPEISKLHQELCPDCPFDGHTIFTREKREMS